MQTGITTLNNIHIWNIIYIIVEMPMIMSTIIKQCSIKSIEFIQSSFKRLLFKFAKFNYKLNIL